MRKKKRNSKPGSAKFATGATRRPYYGIVLPTALIVVVLAILILGGRWLLLHQEQPRSTNSGTRAVPTKIEPAALLTTPTMRQKQTSHQAALNPNQDGWESEALSEAVQKQMAAIAHWFMDERPSDRNVIPPVVQFAADFSCGPLRPKQLNVVFQDDTVTVRRAELEGAQAAAELQTGEAALTEALLAMRTPLAAAEHIQVKVKTVRIDMAADRIDTSHLVEVSGEHSDRIVEQHATWHCQWRRGEGNGLDLVSVMVIDYEESVSRCPQGRWFHDCTLAVLGDNPSFHEQLIYGQEHWLRRIELIQEMTDMQRNGVTVGDVNGDGLEDIFLCQGGGLPNRLYLQNEDGTASDQSTTAGIDVLDHTNCALLVDLDNDGDQDLVLAVPKHIIVMENDSRGQFKKVFQFEAADSDIEALSAADYDQDGDLDIYACVYFARQAARAGETAGTFVFHDALGGGANVLLQNDSFEEAGWRFTDVTADAGMDDQNRRYSLAAAWEDYDNDGDQDLYVANDYGRNCLYRNDGGHFTEVAVESSVVDLAQGMSVNWADYDRDGWMDVYIGNMFSSAGSRVTRAGKFRPDMDVELRALYQRFAKGNSLFRNLGNGRFEEVGAESAVEMGRWAWGCAFADVNNDGWEDILVANGYFTTEDTHDL